MHDTLPYREGTVNLNLHQLKQWAGTSYQRSQSRRSSLSSSQASDSSDNSSVSSDASSQATNDSDFTAATSLSPDTFDQFEPSHINDVFGDDGPENNCQVPDSVPTAPLISPTYDETAKFTRLHGFGHNLQYERSTSTKGTDPGFLFNLKTIVRQGVGDPNRVNSHNSVPTTSNARISVQSLPADGCMSFDNVTRPARERDQFSTLQPRNLDIVPITTDNVTRHKAGINQEFRTHPRRTKPQNLRPPPTLQRQEQRRHTYVDALVDITMRIIAKIWPSSCHPVQLTAEYGQQQNIKSNPVICLRYFVEEVLKRSRTSHSTLQVALFYCYKLGRSGKILPPDATRSPQQSTTSRLLQCGRRMFLCSLILASKFIQDRNYSTRAWSKISSLPINEINQCETAMLRALDYRIFIKAETFTDWSRQTTCCVEQIRLGLNCPFENLDAVLDSDVVPVKNLSVSTLPLSTIEPRCLNTSENSAEQQAAPIRTKALALPAELSRRQSNDGFSASIPPMPPAPHLSNASSPSSSPDSDSGHPSSGIGSIIHWNTSHPNLGLPLPVGVENVLGNGLLTPTSTSAGSVDGTDSTTSISVGGIQLSPRSRALDAQAWSELVHAKQREAQSTSPQSVVSVLETPVGDDATLPEQEAYLEQNPWVEAAEDDLMRQLERRTENRKSRQQPVSMQRKRSIGRCLGNQPRHHSGRGEKKPCRK